MCVYHHDVVPLAGISLTLDRILKCSCSNQTSNPILS